MPIMPGYSHYYLTRHLAQQTLCEPLSPSEEEDDAQAATPAEENAFRSGVMLVLFLVGLPLIGIAIVALSYPANAS